MQEKFNLICQLLHFLLIVTMVHIVITKNISGRHNFCLQVLCPLMLLNIRKFQCKHSLDIQKKVQLLGIAKLTLIVGLLSQDTWVFSRHGYLTNCCHGNFYTNVCHQEMQSDRIASFQTQICLQFTRFVGLDVLIRCKYKTPSNWMLFLHKERISCF